jgi:Rrf2 family protein
VYRKGYLVTLTNGKKKDNIMFKAGKSEYAFKIISILKQSHGMTVKGKEIIKELEVSAPYFEQIIAGLVEIGVIETKRGAHGGYSLASQYGSVSAWDVIQRYISKERKSTGTVLDDIYQDLIDNAGSIPLIDLN